MSFKCLLVVLAFAVTFSCAALAGQGDKKKGKKGVKGIVIAVQKDQDKNSGSITVKIQPKPKAGDPAGEVKEEKFVITTATKFEKLTRVAKGDVKREPARFQDVATGSRVQILATADNKNTARIVEILVKKGKK